MYKDPHIAITVNDIQATKDFYSAIGFEVLQDIHSEEKKRHFLLLSGFGLEIEVFRFDDQTENRFAAPDLYIEGLQHFALPVSDLEAKKQDLLAKGVTLIKDISVSSLGTKNLNIADPTGFIIEFFERI